MSRRGILFVMFFFAVMFFIRLAGAEVTKEQKFKHADKNADGTVDGTEMRKEKKWECNKDNKVNTAREKKADTDCDRVLSSQEKVKVRSKTNTEAEKKYDANGDGWLDAGEGKAYLQDKYTVIKTDGKARVDTTFEEKYDINNDGVIDAQEAALLKKGLEE